MQCTEITRIIISKMPQAFSVFDVVFGCNAPLGYYRSSIPNTSLHYSAFIVLQWCRKKYLQIIESNSISITFVRDAYRVGSLYWWGQNSFEIPVDFAMVCVQLKNLPTQGNLESWSPFQAVIKTRYPCSIEQGVNTR